MDPKTGFTRRQYLKTLAIAGSAAALPNLSSSAKASSVFSEAGLSAVPQEEPAAGADPKIQGLFLIPSTPFTSLRRGGL